MSQWLQKTIEDLSVVLIEGNRYQMLLEGLGRTLLVALGAAIVGLLLGAVIALMRLSDWRLGKCFYPLRLLSTLYVDVIRGTPVVVQLMIIYYAILASTGLSREVIAIISFGLNSAAYTSEMFRAGILAVDRGQTEAGRTLSLGAWQTMRFIVLPQAVRISIPSLFNEFIMLLKETSVVGFIGLMDLTKAGDFIRSRTFSPFWPLLAVALIYFVLVSILTRVFNLLERRLRRGETRSNR